MHSSNRNLDFRCRIVFLESFTAENTKAFLKGTPPEPHLCYAATACSLDTSVPIRIVKSEHIRLCLRRMGIIPTTASVPSNGFANRWASCELETVLSTCLGLLRQVCPSETTSEKTEANAEIAQTYRRLPGVNYQLQVGLIGR